MSIDCMRFAGKRFLNASDQFGKKSRVLIYSFLFFLGIAAYQCCSPNSLPYLLYSVVIVI